MYYVLIEEGKIRHYRGSLEYLKIDCENNGIPFNEKMVVEVEEEPVLFRGEIHFKSDVPEQDIISEQQKEKRAQAYLVEVDPITAHIQRLRDDAQTTEDLSKIEELMLERYSKVEEIKSRYPYPEEKE